MTAQHESPEADRPGGGPQETDDPLLLRHRAEWFQRSRATNDLRSPDALRLKALRQMQAMIAAQKAQASAAATSATTTTTRSATGQSTTRTATATATTAQAPTGTWQAIGPQPITERGFAFSGRVNSIAVDPRDANVVYAGADSGGVWKTTDGGQNWQPLTDTQPSLMVSAVALDPNNPDTVWVGTGGDFDFSLNVYYGAGFLESNDGGATWTNIPGPWASISEDVGATNINSVAVQPGNSSVIIATVRSGDFQNPSGIYLSQDGGNTWSLVLQNFGSSSAIFDPNNGQIAYAGATGCVNQSTDGGVTWQRLPNGPCGSTALQIRVSAADSVVYAFGNGLWRSADAGNTWTQLSPPSVNDDLSFKNALGVSPADSNVVFIAGLFPARSLDGGQTWDFPANFHADYHAFTFSADGGKLYIGNDGGMFSLGSPTAADVSNANPAWQNLNATLQTALLYPGAAVDSNNPSTGYAGTQDNGLLQYSGSLEWPTFLCGDGASAAFGSAGVAYVTCTNLGRNHDPIFKFSNGSFSPAENGIPSTENSSWVAPIVSDPSNPDRVYYGGTHVFQSVNAAGNWTMISPDFQSFMRAIMVAPSDPNTVYAAAQGTMMTTTNALAGAGAIWSQSLSGLPFRWVNGLAVDPQTATTAYAVVGGWSGPSDPLGHVFQTTDGGATWNDISGNLPNIPVDDIAVDTDQPTTLYIGTDIGVFASSDSGNTWNPLMDGLPFAVVTSLRFIHNGRILRAGTHGRGAFDLQLPSVSGTTGGGAM